MEDLYMLQEGPIYEGQTLRLAGIMALGGCEYLGKLVMTVNEPSKTVEVTGYIWQEQGEGLVCHDGITETEEILVLSDLSPGQWKVEEKRGGNTGLEMEFAIEPCLEPDCNVCTGIDFWPLGRGEHCDYNCQCEEPLKCLPHSGVSGPFSVCEISCSIDDDCSPWEECVFMDDGLWGVCEDRSHEYLCNSTENPCDEGFVCKEIELQGSYCEPLFTVYLVPETCHCHDECPDGLYCVELEGQEHWHCLAPCRHDAECPEGIVCAEEDDYFAVCTVNGY